MENWFEIGIITKPQGINGELRILPTTDDPNRFQLLNEVHIKQEKSITAYKITSTRPHKGMVLVKLTDINDRNTAETLVGGVLTIPPEKALPLDTDEYFIRDLIGLDVQAEDGQPLGIVEDVFPTGANDVYTIRDTEGKTFMLPAIKDVILSVSMESKTMTVRLIEGLRELAT